MGDIMKLWQYTAGVIFGVVCLTLSILIVFTSRSNMKMQDTIQARQQQLNASLLGPQAQQIANSILQDMASLATTNDQMRTLLAKHGYNPPPASASTPSDKTITEK